MKKLISLCVAILLVLVPSTALANNGHHHQQGADPPCTVSPDPVLQGTYFTLSEDGMTPGQGVQFWMSDSVGLTVLNATADDAGTAGVTWLAYWSGAHDVMVTDADGLLGGVVFGTCSFDVLP